MPKSQKRKWYSPKKLMNLKPTYGIVFGERSNGKTYGFLEICLKAYLKDGRQSAYIRRYDESLTPKMHGTSFIKHVENGILKDTGWDGIIYKNRKWYLYTLGDDGEKPILASEPFMYTLALNKDEITKSSYNIRDLKYIIFDEFLSRKPELKNEFIIFMNAVSTLVRKKEDVEIYLIGNTVNFSSLYFKEMGISNIRLMKEGTIDVYTYGHSDLKVAVEYAPSLGESAEKTGKYYAFDNPELTMITKGKWELAQYPHPLFRISDTELYTRDIYIQYNEDVICIEVRYSSEHGKFLLFRPYECDDFSETEGFKKAKRVYTNLYMHDRRFCFIPDDKNSIDKAIFNLIRYRKMYFSDNTTGEIFRNFLQQIGKQSYL